MAWRGEIWTVNLDPVRGSEQAGTRPMLILQNDAINRFTTTVMALPLTTNLRRAALPSSVLIRKGDGGRPAESVVLCHQGLGRSRKLAGFFRHQAIPVKFSAIT